MIILETDRLLLKEANLGDSKFIFELLNSPNWIEHIGDRGIKTIEDAENYIQKSLIDSYYYNDFGMYIITLQDEMLPIGLCGLLKRDYLDHPDIGFAILPEYERNGYAYEAAKAILEYSIHDLEYETLLGITSTDNKVSQDLLVKLGMSLQKQITENKETLLVYSN